ncbi:S-4TM family putative pore-forming effector [Vibrio chagasii]|uniref:S-4TM family putative pore-forming effector n=1 Tax=Vibrio chagasii TaxID=170679 RepID=UPI0037358AD5
MTNIIANQKSTEAIEAGTAFRFAYKKAKAWKAAIWSTTLLFAVVQTVASAYIFSNGTPEIDPTPYVVSLLLASVFAGSFGKQQVTKWINMGCTLQRLHDYLVMAVGVRPTHIELPKSKIIELGQKQIRSTPSDKQELENWWSTSLDKVPLSVAKVIATYSTFAWESELRKKYQALLTALLAASVASPIVLALLLNYTISQSIIFTIAPFTPFISVLLDEWITNRQNLNIANDLTKECHTSWRTIVTGKLSEHEIEKSTEQHMNFWQNFRQSATPIFEWIYHYSQRQMEMNMVVDTKELVKQYQDTL